MLGTESYINRCVAAAESIDADELGRLSIGSEIGQGTLFRMRHLGELNVSGSEIHSGLKIPKHKGDGASIRLQQEIEAINLLIGRMPEHAPKVPQFMTLLAVEGQDEAIAVLTEDATKGGQLPIFGMGNLMGVSERAVKIAKAFKHVGDTEVDTSTIDHSLAFRVGDEERFLDFTPPPVRSTRSIFDNPTTDQIYDLLENGELTVTISRTSVLSQSLSVA